MKPINSFFIFFLMYISLPLYDSLIINYMSSKGKISIKYEDILIKQNSTYSQVCSQVHDNFDFIGKKGMDLYKLCEGKYDLIGRNDSKISEDKPICFKNLDEFFCNTHLNYDNNDKNIKNEDTEKILSIILRRLTKNLTIQKNHNENFHFNKIFENSISNFDIKYYDSPYFKNLTFRILNSSSICEEIMKTKINHFLNNIQIKEKCEKTLEIYNLCIYSENLLIPNSDYKRCFDARNSFYTSIKLEQLNNKSKDLCSNFVLPSMAWRKNKSDKFTCEQYELTTFKKYDKFIKESLKKEKKYRDFIERITSNKEKSLIIKIKSNQIQYLVKTFKELWKNFVSIFKDISKNKITSNFLLVFSNIKRNAYGLYELLNISNLKDFVKFSNNNFINLNDSFFVKFEKIEILLNKLLNDVKNLNDFTNLTNAIGVRKIESNKETSLKLPIYEIDLIEIKLNTYLEFNFDFLKIYNERLIKQENKYYNDLTKNRYIRESIVYQKKKLKKLISDDYKD